MKVYIVEKWLDIDTVNGKIIEYCVFSTKEKAIKYISDNPNLIYDDYLEEWYYYDSCTSGQITYRINELIVDEELSN